MRYASSGSRHCCRKLTGIDSHLCYNRAQRPTNHRNGEADMTDWAVIGIITTIIVMGLTMIGVQITMFIYLIRRTDAMHREFSEEFRAVRQEISAVVERVARLEGIIIGRLEVGNGLIQTGDD